MSERKPQEQEKFVLRLPDGMRDRIKAAAEANNRSMNGEIVAALEEKFPGPKWINRSIPEIMSYILGDENFPEAGKRADEVNAEFAGSGFQFGVELSGNKEDPDYLQQKVVIRSHTKR